MRVFALAEVALLYVSSKLKQLPWYLNSRSAVLILHRLCNFVFITQGTVVHQIHINVITVVSSIFSGIQ